MYNCQQVAAGSLPGCSLFCPFALQIRRFKNGTIQGVASNKSHLFAIDTEGQVWSSSDPECKQWSVFSDTACPCIHGIAAGGSFLLGAIQDAVVWLEPQDIGCLQWKAMLDVEDKTGKVIKIADMCASKSFACILAEVEVDDDDEGKVAAKDALVTGDEDDHIW
jgi:hypothetical protein